jgi:hypothetical protein
VAVAANRKLTGTSPVSLEREGGPLVAANRKLTGTSPVSLEREGGPLVAANRKLTGTSPVSPEQAACRTGLLLASFHTTAHLQHLIAFARPGPIIEDTTPWPAAGAR